MVFPKGPLCLCLSNCLGHYSTSSASKPELELQPTSLFTQFSREAGGWQRILAGPRHSQAIPGPEPELHSLCVLMVILELPRITPTCSNPALIFTTICDSLSFFLVLLTYIVDFLSTSLFCVSFFIFFLCDYSCYQWSYLTYKSLFYHFCCCCLVTNLCPTLLWPNRLQFARLLCPWTFPGKNAGVGCHFLLQGIFLTQGLKTLFSALSLQGNPFVSFMVILSRKDNWCWCTYAPRWHQWKRTCLPMQET